MDRDQVAYEGLQQPRTTRAYWRSLGLGRANLVVVQSESLCFHTLLIFVVAI
jgi:hypothetical protein